MPDSYIGKVVQSTPTLSDGQMNHLNLDTSGNLKVAIAGGVSVGSVNTSAQYNTSLPTMTSGTTGPLQCDSNGKLLISGTINASSTATYNSSAPTFTNGTSNALQSDVNGRLLVVPANTLATPLRIDPVGTTAQPVTGTFWQATQPVSGTFWQATQPVSIAATITATQTPATSGGLSFYTGSIGATATAIKTSAGQLYGWFLFNSNTSTIYIQIFNRLPGNVTLGTTAPDLVLAIPAGSAANFEAVNGLAFSTAISFAVTTTRSGSTAPTNPADVNFWLK
jgi:hypothetical protein